MNEESPKESSKNHPRIFKTQRGRGEEESGQKVPRAVARVREKNRRERRQGGGVLCGRGCGKYHAGGSALICSKRHHVAFFPLMKFQDDSMLGEQLQKESLGILQPVKRRSQNGVGAGVSAGVGAGVGAQGVRTIRTTPRQSLKTT